MNSLHFLEKDGACWDPESATHFVLPLPYEKTTSFASGTARAPAAILAASEQLELFDEEYMLPYLPRVFTLPAPDVSAGIEESLENIRRAAAEALSKRGRFLMSLGGEHTVTAPLVEAASTVHGEMTVLQLDAHLDLRSDYEGSRFSHACAMRRVMEMGIPIVHVGIRSMCIEEFELVKQTGAELFSASSLAQMPEESWIDKIIGSLSAKVYLTIDSDCFDPAIMPGTGTPEPGGMTWKQVTGLVRSVCSAREVVAADLVEVIPVPGSVISEYTAARLAAKVMMYHAMGKKE